MRSRNNDVGDRADLSKARSSAYEIIDVDAIDTKRMRIEKFYNA